MNPSFSKIWIVVIVVVILAGGILAWQYFGLPREEVKVPEEKIQEEIAKDETAGWKAYRNEKLGIEFKYPPAPAGCEDSCKISENEAEVDMNRASLNIEDSQGLTLSDYIQKYLDNILQNGGINSIESRKDLTIGGKPAVSVAYRFGGPNRYGEVTYMENNGKIFIFQFTAGGFCCEKEDGIYDYDLYSAMLSTFRFLE